MAPLIVEHPRTHAVIRDMTPPPIWLAPAPSVLWALAPSLLLLTGELIVFIWFLLG